MGIRRSFQDACKKAGIRDFHFHDLRHTFAVRCIQRGYAEGANVDQRVAALATYLGHVNVTKTYWYLTAVPELMALVGDRFERFAQHRGGEC